MKRKIIYLLNLLFACCLVFTAGCGGSDNSTSGLQEQIDVLSDKVAALELANAQYKTALEALETADADYQTRLENLNASFAALTESIENATHIERIELTPEELAAGENEFVSFDTKVSIDINCLTIEADVSAIDDVSAADEWSFHLWHGIVTLSAEEIQENYSFYGVVNNRIYRWNLYGLDLNKTYTATMTKFVLYRFH